MNGEVKETFYAAKTVISECNQEELNVCSLWLCR